MWRNCNLHMLLMGYTVERPFWKTMFSSVQFSHSVVSDSLRPHELAAHQASLSIANSRGSLQMLLTVI